MVAPRGSVDFPSEKGSKSKNVRLTLVFAGFVAYEQKLHCAGADSGDYRGEGGGLSKFV